MEIKKQKVKEDLEEISKLTDQKFGAWHLSLGVSGGCGSILVKQNESCFDEILNSFIDDKGLIKTLSKAPREKNNISFKGASELASDLKTLGLDKQDSFVSDFEGIYKSDDMDDANANQIKAERAIQELSSLTGRRSTIVSFLENQDDKTLEEIHGDIEVNFKILKSKYEKFLG